MLGRRGHLQQGLIEGPAHPKLHPWGPRKDVKRGIRVKGVCAGKRRVGGEKEGRKEGESR